MKIVLYKNLSEPVRLDKTLEEVGTLTATLKDSASVMDPVILVSTQSLANLGECNYAQFVNSAFGNRYYFVRNIVSIANGLSEIHLHVDVLSSWKTGIRSNYAVIARNENVFNTYLPDSAIQAQQNDTIVTRTFPNGLNNDSYILVLAGGSST